MNIFLKYSIYKARLYCEKMQCQIPILHFLTTIVESIFIFSFLFINILRLPRNNIFYLLFIVKAYMFSNILFYIRRNTIKCFNTFLKYFFSIN